ncbi:MAG: AAA family ATPase, partial [Duncaniella sp.]|nr:AAA family ATPase [Duncaniella sp.]
MSTTRRKIDIFSIEAIPVTRTSRDKGLWDRPVTRHDWLLRDYSHLSVRVSGMRIHFGKREVRQSFRIVMLNSVTDEILASRTFCIPVPGGERDCEAIVELPLSLAKPEQGVIYLVEVHPLDEEGTKPLCSVPMRFFDLASDGLLPTNIYRPCRGWFVERGENDEPLPSSAHYVEMPQTASYMTVRFTSPLDLAPIQMPEIRARFYFREYMHRRLDCVLSLKGVPPTPPYNLSDNRYEATFAIPAHCGEIFWVEFETLGHVFANFMGRCCVEELEGELFADCFEFGPVDPDTIADDSNSKRWKRQLDERAHELAKVYKPDPTEYREDGVGRWEEIDVDDMLQDFIDSQIRSEEDEESDPFDPIPAQRENITELPVPEFRPTPDGMEALRSMIGLAEVKAKVEATTKTMRFFGLRRDKQLRTKPVALHSLFLASPGTGKTTVARHMGAIMKEAGALSSGHVIETERAKLIGQYYSSTHENTLKAIDEARGGILLIDEAYQL